MTTQLTYLEAIADIATQLDTATRRNIIAHCAQELDQLIENEPANKHRRR